MNGHRHRLRTRLAAIGLVTAPLLLISCASIGPKTIPRDQFDYGMAISGSMKQQLLNNIMRLRYIEAPTFVNVSSVINQYALEGEVGAGFGWNSSITGDNASTLAGSARFADRPTITYTPISGRQFSVSLLTPVSPEAIFALVQAGWSPSFIMRMTVRSLNGVENASASPLGRKQASPAFDEIMNAWARLRENRALGLRKDEIDGRSTILVYRTPTEVNPEVARDLQVLQDRLELDPADDQYKLTYGLVAHAPNEIAVLTLSMLELMNELAWRADVPAEHIEEGRTGPTFRDEGAVQPLIRIHQASERPEDSFVAVRSRDTWFYIDDRDVASKRTFAIMQILLSLTESGEAARGPVVTIGG